MHTDANTPHDDLTDRLAGLVRASPLLMRALRAARTVAPPEWLIGAGVLRDRVWDQLHGIARPASSDVDLAFYDPSSLCADRERAVQVALAAQAPDISWDVTNHASVHLWYPEVFGTPVEPLTSCEDGVATWPETATSVAVRLLADDMLQIVAPYGLGDLFAMVCRHNPRRASIEQYRRRVQAKQIRGRWPNVQILDGPHPAAGAREGSAPELDGAAHP